MSRQGDFMTSVLLHRLYPQAIIRALTLTRQRLLIQVKDTGSQPDEHFPHAFAKLVVAVESAFCQEESLMEAAAYPGLHEQRRDNALLLRALHHAAVQVETGNIAIGREVTAALPDLLSLHRLSALRMLVHGLGDQRAGVVMRIGRLRLHAGSRRRAGEGAR